MTKWTDEETRTLKRMIMDQRSNVEIGDRLGRTVYSVESRAKLLSLHRPSAAELQAQRKSKRSKNSIHPCWGMSDDDRRQAFYEKFQAGWTEVLKRLEQPNA